MSKKRDLSRLSRQDKLALIDALEEKRKRKLLAVSPFVPHDGQLPILRHRAVERYVFSGNGFGKTQMAAEVADAWARGWDPWLEVTTKVPAKIVVLLDSPSKVAELWIPALQKFHHFEPEQFQKRGKPYISAITYPNGSEIIFMFHEQDPMVFESIEVDYVICDEPPPRAIYISLFIRGARKKGSKPRHLMVGTPIAAAWLRKEIWEPWSRGEFSSDEIMCFKGDTAANRENLADGYIERMKSRLSEKEQGIRLRGDFFDLDGLALGHLWRRTEHVIPAPASLEVIHEFKENKWPCAIIVDPHPSKKTVAILMGKDSRGQGFVLDEMARKLPAREFAVELKDWMALYRVVDVVVDSLGSGEMTAGEGYKSFIQVLNEVGVRARPTSFKEKSDEDFVDRLQDALVIENGKDPALKVLEHCRGTINDVENAEWQTGRNVNGQYVKPKLAIDNRDYLACVKYGLAAGVISRHFGRTRIIEIAQGEVGWRSRSRF